MASVWTVQWHCHKLGSWTDELHTNERCLFGWPAILKEKGTSRNSVDSFTCYFQNSHKRIRISSRCSFSTVALHTKQVSIASVCIDAIKNASNTPHISEWVERSACESFNHRSMYICYIYIYACMCRCLRINFTNGLFVQNTILFEFTIVRPSS